MADPAEVGHMRSVQKQKYIFKDGEITILRSDGPGAREEFLIDVQNYINNAQLEAAVDKMKK